MEIELEAFAKVFVDSVIQSAQKTLMKELEETQKIIISGKSEFDETASEEERKTVFQMVRQQELIRIVNVSESQCLESGDNKSVKKDIAEPTQNPSCQETLELFNPRKLQDYSVEIHKIFSGTDVRHLSPHLTRAQTTKSEHTLNGTADTIFTETELQQDIKAEGKRSLDKTVDRKGREKTSFGRRFLRAMSDIFRKKSKKNTAAIETKMQNGIVQKGGDDKND